MAAAEQHRPRMLARLNMLISIGHHARENRLEHLRREWALFPLAVDGGSRRSTLRNRRDSHDFIGRRVAAPPAPLNLSALLTKRTVVTVTFAVSNLRYEPSSANRAEPRMIHGTRFSWATGLCRSVTGRPARRFYLALLLLLVVFSGSIRVRSYLLTRKIQVVLSGLEQLRVDATSEEQLLRTVPYLVRDPREIRVGARVHRGYRASFSNEEDMWMAYRLRGFFQSVWPLRQE